MFKLKIKKSMLHKKGLKREFLALKDAGLALFLEHAGYIRPVKKMLNCY